MKLTETEVRAPETKPSKEGKEMLPLVTQKGTLRTTTKFTTTTSVDWEKTGTRTSVSAGKRKLKMQSVGRSTTTTLNVNTNENCDVRSQQSCKINARSNV